MKTEIRPEDGLTCTKNKEWGKKWEKETKKAVKNEKERKKQNWGKVAHWYVMSAVSESGNLSSNPRGVPLQQGKTLLCIFRDNQTVSI